MPPRSSCASPGVRTAGTRKFPMVVTILTTIGPFKVKIEETNRANAVSTLRKRIMNLHLRTLEHGGQVRLEMDHVVGYRIG